MRFLKGSKEFLFLQKATLPVSQATMNHRDIARHQASSSVLRRDVSATHFLGEEVTPTKSSVQRGRGDCSSSNSSLPDDPHSSQLLHQAKAQNQGNFLTN